MSSRLTEPAGPGPPREEGPRRGVGAGKARGLESKLRLREDESLSRQVRDGFRTEASLVLVPLAAQRPLLSVSLGSWKDET